MSLDEGDFDSGFGPDYDHTSGSVVTPTGPLVRLVLDLGVDDHVRPRHVFWRRYRYPITQSAVLLWRDGRTFRTAQPDDAMYFDADWVAAGGNDSIFHEDDWQVAVLEAAGYTLEAVPT